MGRFRTGVEILTVAAVAAMATPAEAQGCLTRRIELGDSLWKISQDYSAVTVDKLLEWNPQITDRRLIYAGKNLRICKAGIGGNVNIVVPGATPTPVDVQTQIQGSTPENAVLVGDGNFKFSGDKKALWVVLDYNDPRFNRKTVTVTAGPNTELRSIIGKFFGPERITEMGKTGIEPVPTGQLSYAIDSKDRDTMVQIWEGGQSGPMPQPMGSRWLLKLEKPDAGSEYKININSFHAGQ